MCVYINIVKYLFNWAVHSIIFEQISVTMSIIFLIIKNKKLMFRYDFEMHLLCYTCAAILASLYCLYGKISNNII